MNVFSYDITTSSRSHRFAALESSQDQGDHFISQFLDRFVALGVGLYLLRLLNAVSTLHSWVLAPVVVVVALVASRAYASSRAVQLFAVGVDEAKGLLYARLRLREPGPGYCHFPISGAYDVRYFDGLTAEKAVTRYRKGRPHREWVKLRERNEQLDCRVYAMAALYLLNPAWDVIEARRDQSEPKAPEQPSALDQVAKERQRKVSRGRRRHGGWVGGFR